MTSAKETFQPKLDLAILEEFSNKTIVFGVLDTWGICKSSRRRALQEGFVRPSVMFLQSC